MSKWLLWCRFGCCYGDVASVRRCGLLWCWQSCSNGDVAVVCSGDVTVLVAMDSIFLSLYGFSHFYRKKEYPPNPDTSEMKRQTQIAKKIICKKYHLLGRSPLILEPCRSASRPCRGGPPWGSGGPGGWAPWYGFRSLPCPAPMWPPLQAGGQALSWRPLGELTHKTRTTGTATEVVTEEKISRC